jgi:hypothetical protein
MQALSKAAVMTLEVFRLESESIVALSAGFRDACLSSLKIVHSEFDFRNLIFLCAAIEESLISSLNLASNSLEDKDTFALVARLQHMGLEKLDMSRKLDD